ncbi:MAG TPA: hypothetical protein HA346_06645 [Thermoplasmata archaeon]|nr:hypothetical protein [Thermoplasmata archaeon]
MIDNDTALLTINGFLHPNVFEMFLEGVFSEIKERNTKYLIIDIRENGGGNMLGILLLRHLTEEPFREKSRIDIKISEQFKEITKGNFVGTYDYEVVDNELSAYFRESQKDVGMKTSKAEVGSILSYEQPYYIPKPNPQRFNGDVFLLIGDHTRSAAVTFAAAIKDFEIGKIIGGETGGKATQYGGYNPCITLPNSKLVVSCSNS